jgi:hypothetical protein
MRTAGSDLDRIDAELKVASLLLDGARRKFRSRPSEQNAQALERARDDVDRLLDHRLLACR